MSEDVFLQAFERGEPQAIPTNEILKRLAPFIKEQSDDFVDVAFGPQDSCTFYFDTANPTVEGLNVNRPCGDRRLAEALFQIMTLGNFVLFVPGEDQPIVLRTETTPHLPEDLLDALGEPVVTSDVVAFTKQFMAGG